MVRRDAAHVVHRVGGHRTQVHGLALQRALLVQAGEQQEVLDQQPHARGLALDPLHDPVEVGAASHGALPVELREPPDGRERGAQLVAGVADEPAHPVLRGAGLLLAALLRLVRGLEAVDHAVEGGREAPDLGAGIEHRHAAAEVALGDGVRGRLHLDERAEAPPDEVPRETGGQRERGEADERVDGEQSPDRLLHAAQREGEHEALAVGQGDDAGAPVRAAVGGRHGERPARQPPGPLGVQRRQLRRCGLTADVAEPVGHLRARAVVLRRVEVDGSDAAAARTGPAASSAPAVPVRVGVVERAADVGRPLAGGPGAERQVGVDAVQQVAAQRDRPGEAGREHDESGREQQQREQLGVQRQRADRGQPHRGVRSTYPTPRTVCSSRGSEVSSLRRRYDTYDSTTLPSPPKS